MLLRLKTRIFTRSTASSFWIEQHVNAFDELWRELEDDRGARFAAIVARSARSGRGRAGRTSPPRPAPTRSTSTTSRAIPIGSHGDRLYTFDASGKLIRAATSKVAPGYRDLEQLGSAPYRLVGEATDFKGNVPGKVRLRLEVGPSNGHLSVDSGWIPNVNQPPAKTGS